MKRVFDFDVLLLDIEGTTTPISFVHDILFPYARRSMASFIREHWNEPLLEEDWDALRTQHRLDHETGYEDLPALHTVLLGSDEEREELIAYIFWLMDHDRKVTGLKSIQGKIWSKGYAEGVLKGQLFEDVPQIFKQLHAQNTPIYIYSSGSIQAQKLLFGHTEYGDLLPYLSGHFDTTIGSKKECESYQSIAQNIGVLPSRILFVTDLLAEAQAAQKAGMQARIAERPGNHSQPAHLFPILRDLRPVVVH